MRIRLLPLTVAFALLDALSCASAMRQTVYVAPSTRTVTTETVASYNGHSQLIYATNNSTVPIVVTSIQLRNCENIHNSCDLTRMRVPVSPHQRVLLVTVDPENPEREYSYNFGWSWEAAQ